MAYTPPAVVTAACKGLCPRCGSPTLFDGAIRFAPRCRACGLDFTAFNVGDGPAALLVLVIGGLITGLAIALELLAEPPFWVHILLWLPVTSISVILSLRLAKGALLVMEYRQQAREGRLKDPE